MNLFIDTSLYLSFYDNTNDNLEELKKLLEVNCDIWLPEQVCDEFYRNRENNINKALEDLKSDNKQPNKRLSGARFIVDYPDFMELQEILQEYRKKHTKKQDSLISKIMQDVERKNLDVDKIIEEIFSKSHKIEISDKIFSAAKFRSEKGNPPGNSEKKKKNYESIGDAINWESLLEKIPLGKDLHIISKDSDYFSSVNKELPDSYLKEEWEENKKTKIFVYKHLFDFFDKHYPSVKFAADLRKQIAIDKLISSINFKETHKQVEKLSGINSFTLREINGLVDAALNNSQIYAILSDPDVKDFYTKLIKENKDSIEERQRDEILKAME